MGPACVAFPKHEASYLHYGTCTLCFPNETRAPSLAERSAGTVEHPMAFCPRCGKPNASADSYCGGCGQTLASGLAYRAATPAASGLAPHVTSAPSVRYNAPPRAYENSNSRRPGQLTGAAVLMFVTGGCSLLAAFAYLALGQFAGVLVVVGVLLLAIGALEIWIGVALLQLRYWARVAGIVLAAISVLFAFIALLQGSTLSIVSLGLNIALIILLSSRAAHDGAQG
jgi:hypothetical protein